MNSGELKVDDVPLASVESDVDEDVEDTNVDRKTKVLERISKTPQNSPKPHRAALGVAQSKSRSSSANRRASPRFNLDGDDSATGSLEDLVNSFDEKITKVFQDYKEQVDSIAPVQVRSQEEIMNECQVWWTITGNFGNMAPIDWSKSTARAKHLPTLNLKRASGANSNPEPQEEDDDIVRADLDMHSLILRDNHLGPSGQDPIVTADDVLKEIDDMIEEDERAMDEADEMLESGHQHQLGLGNLQRSSMIVHQALSGRKLEELSTNELTQILNDIETLVKDLSEELVTDLSQRDDLEFEKELKNNFISLLLSIQSKRRQLKTTDKSGQNKYLNTVIPYLPDKGTPPLSTLQVLVKILKAVNEDSPAVPAMLTDYILKILCPS